MIPFRLVALGLTVVITVGYAIYKHYKEAPQQLSYGPRSGMDRTDENECSIPVQPSTSNSARELRRRKKTVSNCSICLINVESTDPKARYLQCGHGFHRECINVWFNTQKTCPNCRAPVL